MTDDAEIDTFEEHPIARIELDGESARVELTTPKTADVSVSRSMPSLLALTSTMAMTMGPGFEGPSRPGLAPFHDPPADSGGFRDREEERRRQVDKLRAERAAKHTKLQAVKAARRAAKGR